MSFYKGPKQIGAIGTVNRVGSKPLWHIHIGCTRLLQSSASSTCAAAKYRQVRATQMTLPRGLKNSSMMNITFYCLKHSTILSQSWYNSFFDALLYHNFYGIFYGKTDIWVRWLLPLYHVFSYDYLRLCLNFFHGRFYHNIGTLWYL